MVPLMIQLQFQNIYNYISHKIRDSKRYGPSNDSITVSDLELLVDLELPNFIDAIHDIAAIEKLPQNPGALKWLI